MTDLAMRDGRSRIPAHRALRGARHLRPSMAAEIGKSVGARLGQRCRHLLGGDDGSPGLGRRGAKLAREGIRARLLHFGTIKPIDRAAVAKAARDCGRSSPWRTIRYRAGSAGRSARSSPRRTLPRQAARLPRRLHGIGRRRLDLRQVVGCGRHSLRGACAARPKNSVP